MIINILLAIFGFVGTLSAFGGETWLKGDLPIIKRVTKRGWLSLICILFAFTLGVIKEITIQNEKLRSKNENESLANEIKVMRDSLVLITTKMSEASSRVTESVERIGTQQVSQLEDAFRLAAKIPREYDDCVVHLDGQSSITLPSRHGNNMELYWGDDFEFTFFYEGHEVDIQDLSSIKLEVEGKTYDLHPGSGNEFYHGSVRIYGRNPQPMTGIIRNPMGLQNISLKIFIRSTDATRGQQEFRNLVMSSQFAEYARRVYKRVATNNLNLRANPSETAPIRSTLTKGSFVRILQSQSQWVEVLTPEGRQGWVKSEYLEIIE